MDSRRKRFAVLAAIESAFVVQVAWTVIEDPSAARVRASLIELAIIAAVLVAGWWVIVRRGR